MLNEADERICISTSRATLELVQLQMSDAQKLFELIDRNRTHLSQWEDNTADKYKTLGAVMKSIRHPPNPDRLRFGIWDGSLVGAINLTPSSLDNSLYKAEVGYWVGAEYCGRGIARLATTAIVKYAFTEYHYLQVLAHTHVDNVASQHVLWHSGFVLDSAGVKENTVFFKQSKAIWLDRRRE